jgi:hypothetical protein
VDSPNILYPITAAAANKIVQNPMLKLKKHRPKLSVKAPKKNDMQYMDGQHIG